MGLINGGTAGMIWMYLICWIAFLFIYASMSEMASMAPTSGGQYHWVSEFAPRKYQRPLSYFIGWLSVLGWQAATAGSAYLTGTMIQGMYLSRNASGPPHRHRHYLCVFLGQLHRLTLDSAALIILNNPSYVSQPWHGTLLTIACMGVTVLFNAFLARKLPLVEGTLVVIHIFGFFGVMVTLWVLSPTGDPKSVFVST